MDLLMTGSSVLQCIPCYGKVLTIFSASFVIPVCSVCCAHGRSECGECGAGASCTATGSVSCARVPHFLCALPGFSSVFQPAATLRDTGQRERQEKQLKDASALSGRLTTMCLGAFTCFCYCFKKRGLNVAKLFITFISKYSVRGPCIGIE